MKIVSNIVEVHIFRIVNKKMQFLILRRSNDFSYPLVWQMVTGKNEINERAVDTVVREVKEETGLEIIKMWVVPNTNFYFDYENDELNLIPVFAVQVDKDEEVNISEEHSTYKWVDYNIAKKMYAWPGQKESIDVIYNYFMKNKKILNLVEIKEISKT
ncbi:MAG: NUDIX domain-containing protein [Ignavibacteriales bacterium]|nr:NUDIX domain-containing protein [Ignavibacteriales bacterium]